MENKKIIMTEKNKTKTFLKLSKAKIIFLLSAILIVFSLCSLENNDSPMALYQQKEADFPEICKRIRNSQIKELCFAIIESNSFDEGKIDSILRKEAKNDLKRTCGFLEFGSAPYCFSNQEIAQIIEESKDNSQICQLEYLESLKLSGAISAIPPQTYCQAIVENPYFCGKIPLDILEFGNANLQQRDCYLDAAIIWQDDSLCEKLKEEERDSCYLMIIARNL